MTDPRRLLEREALLPPRLRAALRSAPGEPGSAELRSLSAKLGVSLGSALASAPALGAVGAAKSGALSLVWWGLGGAAMGVGLASVLAVTGVAFDNPTPTHLPASSATVMASAVAAVAPSSAVAESPADEPAAPAIEQHASKPSGDGRSDALRTPEALEPGESEFSLLRRAQGALSSDPGKAFGLSRVHEQSFPDGALAQEREVLAIDALLRLGRKNEAALRARAFGARFPGSVHGPRVDGLMAGHR
jgi:hypothetical protein